MPMILVVCHLSQSKEKTGSESATSCVLPVQNNIILELELFEW